MRRMIKGLFNRDIKSANIMVTDKGQTKGTNQRPSPFSPDITEFIRLLAIHEVRYVIVGGEVVDAFAMWGGIEIKVPTNWQVNMQGTPILGAMENKTTFHASNDKDSRPGKSAKKLTVRGTAIMGGVEIKN